MGASMRPHRKTGASLPKPLQAVLIVSMAGMMVLAATHLAHSGSGGARSPRLLLQGALELAQATQAAAALHAVPDGDAHLQPQVAAAAGQAQQPQAGVAGEPPHGDDDRQLADLQQQGVQLGAAEGGADEDEDDAEWFAHSTSASSSSSSSAAGGSPAASSSSGGAVGGLDEPTLDDSSDLATFAGPGISCLVTPAHGKVALLFITPQTQLPHDLTWTAWMREARGLLPRGSLAGPDAFCLKQCDSSGICTRRCGAAAACNPLCVAAAREELGPQRSPSLLQQQHLFSVYVHARTQFNDYPEGSVFQGRLIPDRAMAKPGTHSMAVAIKKLVEAAALDQRNEWFVLVGETTVPLYHPLMFYQQLMSERRSRVDACPHKDKLLDRQRSTPAMATDRFNPGQHWRKSTQWFALNRKHAELVAHDSELMGVFGKHCAVGEDKELGRFRECISDQHYIPSLLAMYGLDNETSCDPSGGTYERWVHGHALGETAADRAGRAQGEEEGGHFQLYQPGHVTAELMSSIRSTVGGPPDAPPNDDSELCSGWAAATQAARGAFFDIATLTPETCPTTLGSPEFVQQGGYQDAALHPHCPLLAREFSKAAARWVHRVYRSCTAGLEVLTCSPRLTERDNSWWL